MGAPLNTRSNGSYTRGSGALRSENCREVVRMLRAHNDAITVRELAEQLAASESTGSEPDASQVDSLRIRLHHVDVPKLADMGLLDWDREAQEVSPTDHPVYDGSSADEDGPGASRTTIPALADDRRREILATIESAGGPITREALARRVARRDADGEPSESRIENVTVQLHHCHLPKLADVGLLEYDRNDGTITYQGPSELPPTSRAASDA